MSEIKKKSFVLYSSHWNMIKELDNEKLGLLFRAINEHEFENDCVDLSKYPEVKMAFGFISDTLERDGEKYRSKIEQRSAAGKASAEKRRSQKQRPLNSLNEREHYVIDKTNEKPNISAESRYELRDVAKILSVNKATILRWTRKGLMRCGISKVNGRRFWTGKEILRIWSREG